MDGTMEVDSPDQRGTKRPVEETDSSEPSRPKRIKVGRHYFQTQMASAFGDQLSYFDLP